MKKSLFRTAWHVMLRFQCYHFVFPSHQRHRLPCVRRMARPRMHSWYHDNTSVLIVSWDASLSLQHWNCVYDIDLGKALNVYGWSFKPTRVTAGVRGWGLVSLHFRIHIFKIVVAKSLCLLFIILVLVCFLFLICFIDYVVCVLVVWSVGCCWVMSKDNSLVRERFSTTL